MPRYAQLAELLAPHTALPRLDAQVLLAHILGKPRGWLLAHPEAELTPAQNEQLQAALQRLQKGEPLPYVLGHWQFYGLDFLVTPDVLIPRPETELLVEKALAHAQNCRAPRIFEIATGSGCIAVTLAVQLPGAQITATDISAAALNVARANAERHHVAERIDFVQADLLDFGPATCDLLLSNPPYIPTETLHGLDVYRKEPTLALDGGADGLDLVRRLLADAPPILARGGIALLEIEASQGEAARHLARQHFPDAQIDIHLDLAGLDRLLIVSSVFSQKTGENGVW